MKANRTGFAHSDEMSHNSEVDDGRSNLFSSAMDPDEIQAEKERKKQAKKDLVKTLRNKHQ
jgi:hypothetical protein